MTTSFLIGYLRDVKQLSLLLTVAWLAACASASPELGTVEPGVEQQAIAATRPEHRLHVTFAWSFTEQQARFSGEGATRIEPPYRARLDLFGPRGEAYISAALVEFDLRLPPGASAEMLPPPPLLWSVLGVVLPPPNATLTRATRSGAQVQLEYTENGGRWRFTLENDRLRRAEWEGGRDGGRRTVEVRAYGDRDVPSNVVYRDWLAFRELTLTLNQVHDADPFPPETWYPGRRF